LLQARSTHRRICVSAYRQPVMEPNPPGPKVVNTAKCITLRYSDSCVTDSANNAYLHRSIFNSFRELIFRTPYRTRYRAPTLFFYTLYLFLTSLFHNYCNSFHSFHSTSNNGIHTTPHQYEHQQTDSR
jgi:hypothetical protein